MQITSRQASVKASWLSTYGREWWATWRSSTLFKIVWFAHRHCKEKWKQPATGMKSLIECIIYETPLIFIELCFKPLSNLILGATSTFRDKFTTERRVATSFAVPSVAATYESDTGSQHRALQSLAQPVTSISRLLETVRQRPWSLRLPRHGQGSDRYDR